MTIEKLIGLVLILMPLIAGFGVLMWAISRNGGWKVALLICSVAVVVLACVIVGAILYFGPGTAFGIN